MDEMRKKQAMSMSMMIGNEQIEMLVYVKKCLDMKNGEILTRLSNAIIQLHFKDLSNISLNKEEENGIYLMNPNGKMSEINYNECKNTKTKTKVRKFSNIMQKLSSHQEED